MAEKKDSKKSHSKTNTNSVESKTEEKINAILVNHGYNLVRNIGKGSYATVKLANSNQHKGAVAIKVVSKFDAPADYLKKFLPREIQVVKGLSHPNLIRFFQAIETTHRVYIIMEFAEKGSLLDIIKKDKYIDEERARTWYTQLLDGVEFCHQNGVVHRDIKCENLLMDSNYQLKISDFGFARGNMGTSENEYVLSDTFCGSYAYASPEILKGVPYRAQFSDIWSSGVVLYATVFGRLPFDDTNYSNLLKQVQKPVNFPRDPVVSMDCKLLLRRILAPLRERLRIPEIREQPWMLTDDDYLNALEAEDPKSPDEDDDDEDNKKKSKKKLNNRMSKSVTIK